MKGKEGVFKGSGSHQAPHLAYTHRTMSPAMAAMLARVISAEPAGKLTTTYTTWATMMHQPSPQPRFYGVVEKSKHLYLVRFYNVLIISVLDL